MPTYEYACRDCGEHLEVVQSFKDSPLRVCGACGGPLRKVFSAAGIIFKGSGYYVTDTRKKAGSSGSDKSGKPSTEKSTAPAASSDATSSSPASDSSSSGGTEAKSA
jgi:putative FmdB family regulatory protein